MRTIEHNNESTSIGMSVHPADVLSFMARRRPCGTGVHYWCVEPTSGQKASDKGTELAREYLSFVGEHMAAGNVTLLGCIVADMVKQSAGTDRLGAAELAFLQGVNAYAMAAAKLTRILNINVDE